jgi:hypothetical protein
LRVKSGFFRILDANHGLTHQRTHLLPTIEFTGALSVMDVVMLAIGLVFFGLSIGYVYVCDLL